MPAHYERLSYLDNSFLALETANTHMHVAGIVVFDAVPLRTSKGGIDTDRVRALIESKLHLIPRYRQRLAWVPVERHPVWVDDETFDLDYHVRHYRLPEPGSFDQLRTLVGIIMSTQLDRSKPLWEFNIVEGLESDRFAIVSKIHHCMIDGSAGADLATILLQMEPRKDAVLSHTAGTTPTQRDQHIAAIERDGRFAWKRTSGYYAQAHAENAFFRYKRTFGGGWRAKREAAQEREAPLACALGIGISPI